MKNSFKIKPEDWVKEREIGQFSFILKQTVIFTLAAIPVYLLMNFLLGLINEEWKLTSIMMSSLSSGITIAILQRSNLESEYQKLIKKQKTEQLEDYGKKEK